MATAGKLPIRGFLAGAIKFVLLRGYSPNPSSTVPSSLLLDPLYGSPIEVTTYSGAPAIMALTAAPIETVNLEGSL